MTRIGRLPFFRLTLLLLSALKSSACFGMLAANVIGGCRNVSRQGDSRHAALARDFVLALGM
jgi:hypothetical protein